MSKDIDIEPNDSVTPEASLKKGLTYMEMGLLKEAVSELKKALTDPESKYRAAREIASCLLMLDQPEQAEKVLVHSLLTLDTPFSERLSILGALSDVYAKMDRPDLALDRLIQVFIHDENFLPDLRHRILELQDDIGIASSKIEAAASMALSAVSATEARQRVADPGVTGHGHAAVSKSAALPSVEMSTPVQYSFDKIRWSTGYCTELRAGDMSIITYAPVPVGGLVFLKFNLPTEPESSIEAVAQAVHQETRRQEKGSVLGMRVRFISLESTAKKTLTEFVLGSGGGTESRATEDKVRFQCDQCGRMISASVQGSGKYGKCACEKWVLVPYSYHNPTPENPLRGITLGGARIDSVIGRGGAATVYKGHHHALDVPVAIKVLHPALKVRANEISRRFVREARIIARIHHANIVGVFNAGEEQGHSFIMMQYVQGQNLREPLARGIRYSVEDALRIFLDICNALSAAHKRSVVHGDIKPANILMERGGKAMLADFGLVRELSRLKQASAPLRIFGTPLYMAPEQTRGENAVDFRADIYSLGATMYHTLAGKPPFDGTEVGPLIRKHRKETPKPLHEVSPDTPLFLSEVVAKTLSKNPDDRHQSVDELKQDLLEISLAMAVDDLNLESRQ